MNEALFHVTIKTSSIACWQVLSIKIKEMKKAIKLKSQTRHGPGNMHRLIKFYFPIFFYYSFISIILSMNRWHKIIPAEYHADDLGLVGDMYCYMILTECLLFFFLKQLMCICIFFICNVYSTITFYIKLIYHIYI